MSQDEAEVLLAMLIIVVPIIAVIVWCLALDKPTKE